MEDSDREANAARDFLAAKVPAFERTMLPLAPSELVYLYRHRRKIHPKERELGVLLASVLHESRGTLETSRLELIGLGLAELRRCNIPII